MSAFRLGVGLSLLLAVIAAGSGHEDAPSQVASDGNDLAQDVWFLMLTDRVDKPLPGFKGDQVCAPVDEMPAPPVMPVPQPVLVRAE
jgi:hypothetical protein